MPTIMTGAKAGNGTTAFAFRQGSTWSTPVAVGAGYGMRINSEGISGGKATLDRVSVGKQWGDAPDLGPEMWRGPVESDLFYGGNCGKWLSLIFGTSGSPTTSGTTCLHVVDLANTLTKFATLCIARRTLAGASTLWHEYDSAMAARLVLRGSGNGRVTATMDVIANTLNRASATNTTAQTDAVTVPTVTHAVRFCDGRFRANAQAGSAITSTTDDLPIAGFELEVMRSLSADFLADGTGELALPSEEDVCSVMLRIDLRSYDADTWKAAWAAGTAYKADLRFLSPANISGSSTPAYYLFQFPNMVLTGEPQANIAGRGRVTHRAELRALVASSAPTGMTGVTQPVRLSVLDGDTAAYLS